MLLRRITRPAGRSLVSVLVIGLFSGSTFGQVQPGSLFVDLLEVNGSAAGAGAVGAVDTIPVMDGDVLTFGINADFTAVTSATYIAGGLFALADVGAFGTAQNIVSSVAFDGNLSLSQVFDDNAIQFQEFQPAGAEQNIGRVLQVATFEFVVDATSGSFSYDMLTAVSPSNGGLNQFYLRSGIGQPFIISQIDPLTADTIRILPTPGVAVVTGLAGLAGVIRRRR